MNSDLQVDSLSRALEGYHIDFVVSGSIGAVESIRFVRALRRLGAEVYPVLTSGGSQFITATALSWAAARPVITEFSGSSGHIAERDACLIAPASASFMGKLVNGIIDHPGLALASSYLSLSKPLILIPNMHESLFHSRYISENIEKLRQTTVVIDGRTEEGKQKFPESNVLADQIANRLNGEKAGRIPTLVTLGRTKAYIDEVRYLSNYSSGALGSLISEELYRWGHPTMVVAGAADILPKTYSKLLRVETNQDMNQAALDVINSGVQQAVLAASVLDYLPSKKEDGKVRSDRDRWSIDLVPSEKIIANIAPLVKTLVAFKLETKIDAGLSDRLALEYCRKYNLALFVMNQLKDVNQTDHQAMIFCPLNSAHELWRKIEGKKELAHYIAEHLRQNKATP